MQASSMSTRLRVCIRFRDWAWWQLPPRSRRYVGAVVLIAITFAAYAASQTSWTSDDLVKFAVLLTCGLVSVAATPRIAYSQGALVRDFLTVWVLPIAVLLPPFFAMVTPIPLLILTQWRIHPGLVYRRVFTAAAIALSYGAAALVFRAFPAHFAGGHIGTGLHALTWVIAVTCCELVGGRGHHFLIQAAMKLSDPTVRLLHMDLSREALHNDVAELDLAVLITVAVGVSPTLAIIGVPTVLLARRYLMHAQLLAKSRLDSKTGLLNASTWESEAEAEIARTIRTRSELSVALVDIDHFKVVNDTYGHLVGDIALRAVSDAIREHLRSYDVAGRFGGEEFVVLLPQAGEADAMSIAERLRTHIAAMAIPIEDNLGTCVRLTVSVGIAAMNGTARELTDLLAAADSALYFAKDSGRNKTHAMAAVGLRLTGELLRAPALPAVPTATGR
jgi:diguanylate cyclase (GGDEF)-like protein